MAKTIIFKSELRVLSEIGITAGQVTFGSAFLTLFSLDKDNSLLLLLSLLLTVLLGEAVFI
jgi:hypothetical protein